MKNSRSFIETNGHGIFFRAHTVQMERGGEKYPKVTFFSRHQNVIYYSLVQMLVK